MKTIIKAEDYTPINGFFDLRNFDLTKKEFESCYNIQTSLKAYADKQNEDKNFKINNKFAWEEAKQLSTELQEFLLPKLKEGANLE